MGEKKVDDSPFLSKMENFEISDKNNKISKNEIKDEYKNLRNEFKFEEEKLENDEQDKVITNEKNNDKKGMNIRTIKVDRKKLKKMFSSQFFTQTLTDDSSSNTERGSKLNKKYFICEFFKRFFIIFLFFITSFYTIFYIYINYFQNKHICGNLDLYNYKYENEVHFIPSISNNKYYIFTGKFPFDVITYKLRKDILKNSMNEELKKYKREDETYIYDQIENIDDHNIQIMSFIKYNNKTKCEKKILDLYKPFYLKTTDANIKNYNYILNEVNYNFITNPFNIPEKKLYMELLNFMKKNEIRNKISFITSYLKSLKDDDIIDNKLLSEHNPPKISNEKKSNDKDDKNINVEDEQNKKNHSQSNNSNGEKQTESIQENSINSYNNNNKSFRNNNYSNNNNMSSKRKIIFLYDSYDNNLVDLIIAIYNMQYGNSSNNLKENWENIKKKFKIVHAEEIYLFEWYCLGINYNVIENNNQYKLNCVDLLK